MTAKRCLQKRICENRHRYIEWTTTEEIDSVDFTEAVEREVDHCDRYVHAMVGVDRGRPLSKRFRPVTGGGTDARRRTSFLRCRSLVGESAYRHIIHTYELPPARDSTDIVFLFRWFFSHFRLLCRVPYTSLPSSLSSIFFYFLLWCFYVLIFFLL